MNKKEYLEQLWHNEKEWNYNVEISNIFQNIIADSNPIVRAMKQTADMIDKADDIKRSELVIEDEDTVYAESFSDRINKANRVLKYDVHGYKTRAYYSARGRNHHDDTDNHLFQTLFKQCLWKKENRSALSNIAFRSTLYFITEGSMRLKYYLQ